MELLEQGWQEVVAILVLYATQMDHAVSVLVSLYRIALVMHLIPLQIFDYSW